MLLAEGEADAFHLAANGRTAAMEAAKGGFVGESLFSIRLIQEFVGGHHRVVACSMPGGNNQESQEEQRKESVHFTCVRMGTHAICKHMRACGDLSSSMSPYHKCTTTQAAWSSCFSSGLMCVNRVRMAVLRTQCWKQRRPDT